jgi:release factor glutamine methyltransferase
VRIDPSIVAGDCENVYPPREDTYLLISAIEVVPDERVLEVGCGSGLVSLHMAKSGAKVTAVDINVAAVECTRRAAAANRVALETYESDLFSAVQGRFDLIVFNPPYLVGDEQPGYMIDRSWAGGQTGTEVLRRFLPGCTEHLHPKGRIVLVVSSHMDQHALASAMGGFEQRIVRSERLFFEELSVLELRPNDPPSS